jgi:tetratricopeptide (TPR) repeat protein
MSRKKWLDRLTGGPSTALLTAFLLCATALVSAAPPPADPAVANLPLVEIAGRPATPPTAAALDQQPAVHELYETARQLVSGGQYAQAAEHLDQALRQADADYAELPYLLGLAKYRLGRLGEARACAELAVRLAPAMTDAHYLLGQLYRLDQQFPRATAHFRTATLAAAREPANPRVTLAWYWLGYCLEETGYLAAAGESYGQFDRAIWEAHPTHLDDAEVAALLADQRLGMIEKRLELLRRLNRPSEAVGVAAEALSRWPEETHVARLYLQALLAADEGAAAWAYCSKRLAATNDGGTSFPLLSLAVAAADAAGALDAFVDDLAARVATGTPFERTRRMGHLLTATGHHAAAARLWQALRRSSPGDAEAAWATAVALRSAGDLAAGVSTLVEFVRAHPDRCEPPWALLVAWMAAREAKSELTELAARLHVAADRDFATDFVLGSAAADSDPEFAVQRFKLVLTERPDFALARVAWGNMLLANYRWDEARTQARLALEAAPRLASGHFVLASALAGLDQNEAALESYRDAYQWAPDDPDYVLALARHYRRTGDTLAAQRFFHEVLERDPDHAEAAEKLVETYLGGGKLSIARSHVLRAEGRDLSDDVLRRIRTAARFAEAPFQEPHLAELARQFELHPDDAQTGLMLAAGLYVRGRTDEAAVIVSKLHAAPPEDYRQGVLAARVYGRQLAYEQAIDILTELLSRYPNRTDLLGLYATACLADFRLEPAREALHRLIETASDERMRNEYRRQLLMSYTEFSEFDGALELLADWAAEDPDTWVLEQLHVLLLADRPDEAVALAAGRLSAADNRFEASRARFRNLLDRLRENPEDSQVQVEAGALRPELEAGEAELMRRREEFVQVCVEAGRGTLAEQQVRQWQEQNPVDPQNMQWLVQLLLADDRPEDALEALSDFQPISAQAEVALRGWRARALAAAGRTDAAVAELEALLDEQGALAHIERSTVWQQLIHILIGDERYDSALDQCDRWFGELNRLDPGSRPARVIWLNCRMTILALAERTAEYSAVAEQLLELERDNIALNNDLGYTWADAGDHLPRATAMIAKAVAGEPLRAAYLDSLGWAYYKASDLAGARRLLGRAIRLREGQDAVIYDHYADTLYRLGDEGAAREHWQKALELLLQEPEEERAARSERLQTAISAKLAALRAGESPQVAPLAPGFE